VFTLLVGSGCATKAPSASAGTVETISFTVLSAEHRTATDPETGAELLYLTSSPDRDINLYFHQHSWLKDGSMILFHSDRKVGDTFSGGMMGYLVETGELVAFDTGKYGLTRGTAAATVGNQLFAIRGQEIVEVTFDIKISAAPAKQPSQVAGHVRVVCTLPKFERASTVTANCTDEWLGMGAAHFEGVGSAAVMLIHVPTGKTRVLHKVGDPPGYAYHIQWSPSNPNLLGFAGLKPRLWAVDIRDGKPWAPYAEWPDELVTHEHWWVNDLIVFCGGTHPEPKEDSHVKTVNIFTGEVRVIGAGSWWPEGTDEQIAKRNYWHCAGSADGRWVVADNWHGDISVFEAKTTRARILTGEHRTYGSGDHPHVGWDRAGNQVVFASHKLGSPDVCVATIPDDWQTANPSEAVEE
jgi:hypothetical protein